MNIYALFMYTDDCRFPRPYCMNVFTSTVGHNYYIVLVYQPAPNTQR